MKETPNIELAIPYTKLTAMGIMKGGAYFPNEDPKGNYFGVKASLSKWPAKWIMTDKMGWLQWWERYCQGRRLPEDIIQIARWQNFGRRHLYGIFTACKAENKTISDIKHWTKAKQALLHWGILATNATYYHEFCGDLLYKENQQIVDKILQ